MKKTIIKAKSLFNGKTNSSNKTIVLEGNKIVDVTTSRAKADFEGIVTPAFIDAHSHIGMFRSGEPDGESEGNDHLHQILPTTDPMHGIYYDDRSFEDAIDFGVLYSCVMPGSGNLFGGRSKVIRHHAKNVDQALVKDFGFKMALGYNPRSTTYWRGERPNTRMGAYGMLEKHFDSVLKKAAKAELQFERSIFELDGRLNKKEIDQKTHKQLKTFAAKEKALALSEEERTLMEALNGRRPIKMHVHKEDDVIYLLHLKEKFGLQITAEHCCDVHSKRIFSLLAKHDVPIIYGPLGTLAAKVELKNEHWSNAKHLVDSNAFYGLMTDHPVVHVSHLRDSLKYFMYAGVSPSKAMSIITYNNAKILQIDDILGSVEPGKLASLLVWDRDPLHLAAIPKVVIGEGKVLRKQ